MGAGGFLLSNYQPELAENFRDGVDMVMYHSIEEAYSLAKYYLEHEDERKAIAENGRKSVERFTYVKQFAKILSIVFKDNRDDEIASISERWN